jgi:FlaG/FlaF family flagellin (archaellin)
MFKSKLWISLIGVILMTAITATTTTTIYAESDNGKDKDRDAATDTEQTTTESETDTDTDTDTEEETQAEEQTASVSSSQDEVANENPGNGDTQPGRVGSHDDYKQTSGEGANAGGTVTDPTITGDPDTVDESDTVSADCFGKVISHEAQEHKETDEGTLGEHSSDPVPELEGNETPRQGIGNQDQGHPSAHGAFNSQFEEEDAENVEENC